MYFRSVCQIKLITSFSVDTYLGVSPIVSANCLMSFTSEMWKFEFTQGISMYFLYKSFFIIQKNSQ